MKRTNFSGVGSAISFIWYFVPDNDNAGGSAICIHRGLLLEEAIVTHLITHHGRDHLVNIRSERHSLVIVNVHFEPELTSRQLRGRLGLVHLHWSAYPNGVGIILGDFNICDPEEGRFNVWNQTFTDGDLGKTAMFHSFFPHSLRLRNLISQEETLQSLVSYALVQGLIVILSIYLWLKHVISIALLMLLSTSGRKLFRVTMLQYASSSRNLLIEETRTNVFPVGGCILQQLHDDHRLSPDPFCALAEFKVLLHKVEKMTRRELSRQTPHCIGAKLLITSTLLRAYRNRHLGTLMRCCEAWKPIKDCFDTLSFECVDLQRICHIFACLTRENLATLETEVSTFPCTQTEQDIALARRRFIQRAWRNKKPVLTLDFVSIGEPFFKHAQKARGIINMLKNCDLFNKLLMTPIGPLFRLSLTTSLLQRKTQLLDLTEFPTVPTDVLVVLAYSSS